jgi:CheY-like chemotaxis protein
LNPEQRRYVEILRESGDALLGVINDILDFSKLEAGKMRLELTDFDIVDTVEGTAGLLEHQAAAKHLAIMTFVAPNIPRELRGDPTKLRQVLINLIGNAVKFTSTGTIVVRATPRETSADSVTVLFSVADTGIGIAETAIGQLFEPFTQADGSTTRTYGGTGLGLSISKQLVAMMGGTLDVESTEGVGSTFWFTAKFDRSPGKEEPAYREITDIRALLIDRDPSSADIVQQYLQAWGVTGVQALSWDDGLEEMHRSAAAKMPYDVVLLDANIDEKSDAERLRALRTNAALSSTPVILLSPLGAGDRAKASIEAGYFASVVRPVRQSPLYDVLVAAAQKLAAPAPPAFRDPFDLAVDPGAPINVPLILIAEDNAINRSIALRQLDKLGYRARAVQNGQQAVEQVRKTAFALVLMDCQMPVMDGFEATRQIRKFETRTGGHIPIIAMTANAMEGDRDACIAAGMDDYISKPVKAATLKTLLERALSHA